MPRTVAVVGACLSNLICWMQRAGHLFSDGRFTQTEGPFVMEGLWLVSIIILVLDEPFVGPVCATIQDHE